MDRDRHRFLQFRLCLRKGEVRIPVQAVLMRNKAVLQLSVPLDIARWIRSEAGRRRKDVSDFGTSLLAAGIDRMTIEAHVAQLRDVMTAEGIFQDILYESVFARELVLASIPERDRDRVLREAHLKAAAARSRYDRQEGNHHVVQAEEQAARPDHRIGGDAP